MRPKAALSNQISVIGRAVDISKFDFFKQDYSGAKLTNIKW